MLFLICSSCALGMAKGDSAQPTVLRTFEEVREACADTNSYNRPLDITGIVIAYYRRPFHNAYHVHIKDGTNRLEIYELTSSNIPTNGYRLLDRVRFIGRIDYYRGVYFAGYDHATVLSTGRTEDLPLVSANDFTSSRWLDQLVRIRGMVRDISADDSDPNFIHLTLGQESATAQVMILDPLRKPADLLHFIGAEVIVTGICSDNRGGLRQHLGRTLSVSGLENIRIQRKPTGFADAPPLEALENALPQEVLRAGNHQCSGSVLATWQGKNLLLETSTGRKVRVHLQACDLPSVGQSVRVLGLPVTDFYNINLIHATWKGLDTHTKPPRDPIDASPHDLLFNEHGQPQLMVLNHGKTIRLEGIVRYLPEATQPNARMQLESDGQIVAVDASARPALLSGLEIGCRLSVAGTCVMDADDWNRNSSEERNRGFFLVPRTVDDIVVLSRPPWWTPGRLMVVIGSLLAALLAILVWNRSLKRLAEKRGKALAAEELERLESDLKVCERTRLAVELHDSIAQNLTGVSMEIDTALRDEEPLPPNAARHMDRALRTIDSCRGELRNCLWDLRSQALEEEDMNKAIRLTLSQTIGKADLNVRFNVPRSRFTDNTAHTLLRIIRELAANAVRHGKATEIKVAGSIEDDVLKFSVRDNGCGFNPDTCPGVLDGHFGLQGIRERVASFEGDIQIESAPGRGSRVSVSINAPQAEDEQKI